LNASKLEVSQEQQLRNISIIGLLVLLIGALWLWFNRLELSKKNKQIYTQSLEISKAYAQLEDFNKTLEQKVDQRTHELKQANIELQQKNEEILTALFEGQTLERKRVASELHNNLGSMLSAMRYRLQILDKEKLSSKEQKVYDSILEMMGTAYAEVRLISHNLLPAELEKKGLKGAIEKLIGDINLGQKLIIDLQMDDDILPKNKRFELELYSICLELINNIIKHAEATQASVSFYEENNLLIFTVSDNGKGMNLEKSNGFGLKNIEQRVQSNSGIMEIHTKEFEKTAIICKFPLEQIA
jgi:signal transduction histidine kinase